jgi:2,4'-dihydroxyacetophenone dioxygenase
VKTSTRTKEARIMLTTTPATATPTLDTTQMAWVPLGPGISFKPLRFYDDDSGYQLLLRVEPGTVVPLHRHTGDVHAFNLSGTREIIGSGQVVTAGKYVYEPVGNIDSWRAIGTEPCVIHIATTGRIEYLDDNAVVARYTDTGTARREYHAWCAAQGVEPMAGLR